MVEAPKPPSGVSGVPQLCPRCYTNPVGECMCSILDVLRRAERFNTRMRVLEQRGDFQSFATALAAVLAGPVMRHGEAPDFLDEAEFTARTLLNAVERIRAERGKAIVYRRASMRLVAEAADEPNSNDQDG